MSTPKEEALNETMVMVNMSEEDRLRRDIYRPDMEKFKLFTAMLRRNALFKKATIIHKIDGNEQKQQ